MSNSDGASVNKGSPSNPNTPRTEESPRRSSVGDNTAPHGSPIGRGFSPRPFRQSPGSSRGTTAGGGLSPAGQAVPVGGGGSGDGCAPRHVGSPAGRKRGRYGGAAADGGSPSEDGGRRTYNCSVCPRVFNTPNAMFGHMRAHPDRGWTGAHPPPSFRAEEEFADLRGAEAAANGGEAGADEEEAGEARSYRVPDLNNPPPPDDI
ncbi:zinc finger family protein [Perilla frutescens var. hirtella]|nr:zinc finger family protein [Perilla frutescens var. hirtella]